MLLDPLEEQLDLPAAFVELGDGERRQGEVVGQEGEGLAGLGIAIGDAAELVRVAVGRTDARGDDDLVADEAGGFIDGVGIEPSELEVGAPPDDEEGGGLGQAMEAGEIDIAAVHDVEGAGLGGQFVEHPGIVPAGAGDVDESRDVAAQIEQRMKLDGGLGALERGPGEQGEAEIDGGGVERVDGVVEIDAEAVLGIERARDADQAFSEVGVDAPVARLVGVGEGAARYIAPDAHVVELGVLGAQTGLDVAQALAVGELGEGHAQVLIEAGKALHLVMAAIALDTAPEAMKGKVVDQLCENDSARVHKPPPRL